MRDDELRRRLRKLESELESGNIPLRPARPDARRGVRMRPAAAGLGMAASIAATIALFLSVLPSPNDGISGVRPAAGSPANDALPDDPAPTIVTPDAVPIEPGTPPSPTPTVPVAPTGGAPAADCFTPQGKDAGQGASITAETSPGQVRRGDTITLRAVFRNTGGSTIENGEGNPRADFEVTDAGGSVVWVYSHGKAFTKELRLAEYAPGEEVAVETTWNLRACGPDGADGPVIDSGTYRVRALWAGEHGGWSGFASFTVG
ncbi:MAG TPA: BsuPI-related putative proteinase inhibitor [Actinomycetota bacterium]|nr:BsuPI-related putative proteinase inhibitor [Actinomycetota bacterium]